MPRVNRRPKRRRAGYDEHHIRHMLTGTYICPGLGFATNPRGCCGDDTDYKAMREAWELMRGELLAAFIAEHPGQRPFAWWRFDAPERRQRTDGVQHPFDNRLRRQHVDGSTTKEFRRVAYELFYGRPRALIVRDDFEAKYEGELQYLNRLGLLTDAERKELL
jgi:hypothetical protein